MGTIQKVGDVEVVSIEDMNTEHYTDTTGASYKTSSIHVYTDRDGNYRSFSDDTKKHIEHCERSIEMSRERGSDPMDLEKQREKHSCPNCGSRDFYHLSHSSKHILGNTYKAIYVVGCANCHKDFIIQETFWFGYGLY